jgi:spermidine/putrescine transport system permease protein
MRRLRAGGRTAYVVAVYGFIFLPVVTLVLFSFQGTAVPVPPFTGPSLRWYQALFADGRMMSALGNSVGVALVSAGASTVLGLFAAYGIARYSPAAARGLRAFLMAPLGVSYLVIAIGLSLAAHQLGLGRGLGMVTLGHVVINLPIAFAVILSQMRDEQIIYEQAARDLGASEARVLATISVPVLLPGIMAAFLLSFTLSWDEFIIALLLSRFDVTLPVEIWSALRTGLNPKTNAAGTLVFALSMAMLVATYTIWRRRANGRR